MLWLFPNSLKLYRSLNIIIKTLNNFKEQYYKHVKIIFMQTIIMNSIMNLFTVFLYKIARLQVKLEHQPSMYMVECVP